MQASNSDLDSPWHRAPLTSAQAVPQNEARHGETSGVSVSPINVVTTMDTTTVQQTPEALDIACKRCCKSARMLFDHHYSTTIANVTCRRALARVNSPLLDCSVWTLVIESVGSRGC